MALARDRQRLAAARKTLGARPDETIAELEHSLETMILGVEVRRAKEGWSDSAVSTLADLRALNARYHITAPDWAPSPLDARAVGEGYLALNELVVRDEFRNAGVARLLLATMEQALCLNPHGFQTLQAVRVHLPLFYVADSRYHWVAIGFAPNDATPAERFPRHFISGWDDPDADRKRRENNVAIYADTDLGWATPLQWHRRRVEVAGNDENIVSDALVTFLAGQDGEATFNHDLSLRRVGDSGQRYLLTELGNLDEGGPLEVHVEEGGSDMLAAFLVDHARVMARPIVWHGSRAPQPPSGERFAAHWRQDKDVWRWMPQRKPHETTYEGTTIIPLPAQEMGRPTHCLDCNTRGVEWLLRDRLGHIFCSDSCYIKYYTQS
jgi:hypothetical protein